MKSVSPSHDRLHGAIALVCLLALSFWSTWENISLRHVGAFADVMTRTVAGPVAGWFGAMQDHTVRGSLELLLLDSGITLGLAVFYFFVRALPLALLATAWWWVSGFYFAVGMWQ